MEQIQRKWPVWFKDFNSILDFKTTFIQIIHVLIDLFLTTLTASKGLK